MFLFNYTRSQWKSLSNEADPSIGSRIWENVNKELQLRKLRSNIFIGVVAVTSVAAAVVLGFVIGHNALPVPEVQAGHYTSVIAAAGNTNVLPDGSKVWLETGSSLEYDSDFSSNRKVVLNGNATFDVVKQKDEAKFEVVAGGTSVIVKGTSFTVAQNNSDEVTVTLYEGAVDFSASGKTVSIEPGTSLRWDKTTSSVVTRPFFKNINWKDGSYRLRDASLSTLADFIRWKYNVEVYVSPKVRQEEIKLTGMVRYDESVDSVIDKVCYVMGLSCSRKGTSYRLFKQQ